MSTQALSRAPLLPATDKARNAPATEPIGQGQPKQNNSSVFIPPNEFRMKLLKRILSVDGTIDNKALQKLQKTSSERTLQANILFQNGDVGTLISFDRVPDDKENQEADKDCEGLPAIVPKKERRRERRADGEPIERPLKLPPIMLPPIYKLTPRPLTLRDYSGPTAIPPPPCEDDWEDLEDCRYLRQAKKQFLTTKESKSFLLTNASKSART